MPRARKPAADDLQSTGYGDTANLLRLNEAAPQQRPFVGVDEVPNMSAPSSRPNEPVTTGLPTGPGAGPEVLAPMGDPVRRTLQTILLYNPENNAAMRLLEMLDSMGR